MLPSIQIALALPVLLDVHETAKAVNGWPLATDAAQSSLALLELPADLFGWFGGHSASSLSVMLINSSSSGDPGGIYFGSVSTRYLRAFS